MNFGFVETEGMLGFPEELKRMITWWRRLNEFELRLVRFYPCHVMGYVASTSTPLFQHSWWWDDDEWSFRKRISRNNYNVVHRARLFN